MFDAGEMVAAGAPVLTLVRKSDFRVKVYADVKKIRMRGWVSDSRARQVAMPVIGQIRILFNPAFNANYATFLVLGFVAIAIQLAPLLSACRAGARELGPGAAELRSMSLMGAGPAQLWRHLAVLIAWAPISMIWAFWAMDRGPQPRSADSLPAGHVAEAGSPHQG